MGLSGKSRHAGGCDEEGRRRWKVAAGVCQKQAAGAFLPKAPVEPERMEYEDG